MLVLGFIVCITFCADFEVKMMKKKHIERCFMFLLDTLQDPRPSFEQLLYFKAIQLTMAENCELFMWENICI